MKTSTALQITGMVLALGVATAAAQQDRGTQPKAPTDTQQKATTAAKSTGGTHRADEAFVKEAAMGGMAEVELGKLASDKASDDAVKQFGKRMADDHGAANQELQQLAAKKNITLTTALDAKHKATHDRLSRMSGKGFDRAYVNDMVADHKKDVAAFRKESQQGQDPDVKAWAAKTLPTLEDHLRQIEGLQKQSSGAKSTAKSSSAKPSASTAPAAK